MVTEPSAQPPRRTRACPIADPRPFAHSDDESPTLDLETGTDTRFASVFAVFTRASSVSGVERERVLDEVDSVIRAEVIELLERDTDPPDVESLRGHIRGEQSSTEILDELPERLGRFEPTQILGKGGMGVVYLATDPALERQVALKVLPREFSLDAERVRRFKREATLLASLNHTGIATIYGLEESDDDQLILVLEYIKGTTLGSRIRHNRPSIEETLHIGEQIAAALESAHARGVIHRDLKPVNVMLSQDSTGGQRSIVKILDFGLARELEVASAAVNPASAWGAMAGTPGYMAPEQIRGAHVDQRADIFALGATLFECLTGTRAFPGATAPDRLRATQHSDPDWTLLPPDTPPSIHRLLSQCLARDVDRRPAHVSRVREMLSEAIRAPSWSVERPTPRVDTNLPALLTSFVGRQAEIMRLTAMMEHTRLLSLTGPGGCGKTRLGVELACWVADEYRDGVWFVDLADLRAVEHVAPTVLRTLGGSSSAGSPVSQALVEHIGQKRMLLALDNCEHLLDATAQLVATVLRACPHASVVCTSREPLNVPGEQTYPVPSLALPTTSRPQLKQAMRCDAVRLFMERARLTSPSFELTEQTVGPVVSICRRLDGIPLAIELAAPCLRVMSVEQLESRLHDGFRLLAGRDRSVLPRHQTLRAAFDWSFDLLTAAERLLFGRLTVFAGGWTLSAAEEICAQAEDISSDDVLELLTGLIEKSLVVSDAGRYRVLEVIRAHAQERLSVPEEESALHRRHLEYFLRFAEDAAPELSGPQQGHWLECLHIEHANLRIALTTSRRDDVEPDIGLRLATALHRFWYVRSYLEEGRAALDRALARRGAAMDVLHGRALNAAGIFAWLGGDFATARARYEHAMAIWDSMGDQRQVAGALSNLGVVAHDEGESDASIQAHRSALEIYHSLGDHGGAAQAELNLGVVLEQTGDFEGARTCFASCLQVFEKQNDEHRIAVTLHNLGEVTYRLGDDDEGAKRTFRRSLAGSLRLADQYNAALTLVSLAMVLRRDGAHVPAARTIGLAAAMRTSVGEQLPEADRRAHETLVAELSDELGSESFDAAWEEGQAMLGSESIMGALVEAGCFR